MKGDYFLTELSMKTVPKTSFKISHFLYLAANNNPKPAQAILAIVVKYLVCESAHNKPFAFYDHMVQKPQCWRANCQVGTKRGPPQSGPPAGPHLDPFRTPFWTPFWTLLFSFFSFFFQLCFLKDV